MKNALLLLAILALPASVSAFSSNHVVTSHTGTAAMDVYIESHPGPYIVDQIIFHTSGTVTSGTLACSVDSVDGDTYDGAEMQWDMAGLDDMVIGGGDLGLIMKSGDRLHCTFPNTDADTWTLRVWSR